MAVRGEMGFQFLKNRCKSENEDCEVIFLDDDSSGEESDDIVLDDDVSEPIELPEVVDLPDKDEKRIIEEISNCGKEKIHPYLVGGEGAR